MVDEYRPALWMKQVMCCDVMWCDVMMWCDVVWINYSQKLQSMNDSCTTNFNSISLWGCGYDFEMYIFQIQLGIDILTFQIDIILSWNECKGIQLMVNQSCSDNGLVPSAASHYLNHRWQRSAIPNDVTLSQSGKIRLLHWNPLTIY